MANPTDIESAGDGAKDGAKRVSRRAFIKGVLGSGIAASSANYLFRTSTLLQGQPPAVGGERLITLNVNGQQRRVDEAPYREPREGQRLQPEARHPALRGHHLRSGQPAERAGNER